MSGAELLAEKLELLLLLGELLRLFAHQLAQFFDLFTIVRRWLGSVGLVGFGFSGWSGCMAGSFLTTFILPAGRGFLSTVA